MSLLERRGPASDLGVVQHDPRSTDPEPDQLSRIGAGSFRWRREVAGEHDVSGVVLTGDGRFHGHRPLASADVALVFTVASVSGT